MLAEPFTSAGSASAAEQVQALMRVPHAAPDSRAKAPRRLRRAKADCVRAACVLFQVAILLVFSACHEGTRASGASDDQGCQPMTAPRDAVVTGPGSLAVVTRASPAAARAFPLHVVPGKRYLVDAANNPFFINGDSPWDLIASLTREEVDHYLEDRRLRGVNTVLVALMEHCFSSHPPENAYGNAPFTTPGDFSTPNEAYFAHADYVIDKAAAKGMLVMLAPAYVGYDGGQQGWWREMAANGKDKLYAYGQYLGRRWRNFDNIVWVDGGDYNVPDKALVRAVANGIRSVDSKPHTFHAQRGTAAMQFWGTGEAWLTVNNIYTGANNVVTSAFAEYARSTAPFFLIEGRYEGSDNATEQTVRMQAYQTLLSGGSGHLIGNEPLWRFGPGWQQLLDSGGARSLLPLAKLFISHAWWTLEPDRDNTTLISDGSTGADRAVAARASDGSFAIAYMPSLRSISIDMSRMAGRATRARWIDPSNGAATPVAGSPFPTAGIRRIQPAGTNSRGFGDWVLLLESQR